MPARAIEFETPRLLLWRWRESDREPFAAMNADPAVMEFFLSPLDRAASDASIDTWQSAFDARGWSNWAVELRESGQFVGFVGLSVPRRVLPFSPCVEVGWRLARACWGKGFATEAGRGALRVGFERLSLPDIVSFTAVGNARSRAVMEHIGLRNAHEDSTTRASPKATRCAGTACTGSAGRNGTRPPADAARRFAQQVHALGTGSGRADGLARVEHRVREAVVAIAGKVEGAAVELDAQRSHQHLFVIGRRHDGRVLPGRAVVVPDVGTRAGLARMRKGLTQLFVAVARIASAGTRAGLRRRVLAFAGRRGPCSGLGDGVGGSLLLEVSGSAVLMAHGELLGLQPAMSALARPASVRSRTVEEGPARAYNCVRTASRRSYSLRTTA
jgi:RimJ/RimL family protein N-acetyltransferase